ncbi:hypothetical protein SDJN03_11410, partial [Cucurbita argyrosperma subsp. sororia]
MILKIKFTKKDPTTTPLDDEKSDQNFSPLPPHELYNARQCKKKLSLKIRLPLMHKSSLDGTTDRPREKRPRDDVQATETITDLELQLPLKKRKALQMYCCEMQTPDILKSSMLPHELLSDCVKSDDKF